jgi:hypothetical protein
MMLTVRRAARVAGAIQFMGLDDSSNKLVQDYSGEEV